MTLALVSHCSNRKVTKTPGNLGTGTLRCLPQKGESLGFGWWNISVYFPVLGPKLDVRAKLRRAVGNGADPAALWGWWLHGTGIGCPGRCKRIVLTLLASGQPAGMGAELRNGFLGESNTGYRSF